MNWIESSSISWRANLARFVGSFPWPNSSDRRVVWLSAVCAKKYALVASADLRTERIIIISSHTFSKYVSSYLYKINMLCKTRIISSSSIVFVLSTVLSILVSIRLGPPSRRNILEQYSRLFSCLGVDQLHTIRGFFLLL